MKRILIILLLMIVVGGATVYFCKYMVRESVDSTAGENETEKISCTMNLSRQEKLALKEIDSKLSPTNTSSLDRRNGEAILTYLKWLEFFDQTDKTSQTEMNYIKDIFYSVDKTFTPTPNTRILKFTGGSPTTTDILLLLSQQCNYHKCPNVCIEDEGYFYAWYKGDFTQGSIVDKKYHTVRGWSVKNNQLEIYN